MRRIAAVSLTAVVTALVIAACGGSGTSPTPTPGGSSGGGGGPITPPANSLPVVDAITVQGLRAAQPPNYGDLGEALTITARVHDEETPADQLQYSWAATLGTFTGTGATVTWQAPASASTPTDVTITLTVTEKYGNPGGPLSFEHSVTATAPLSLHNSTKEVGDMARQFLVDFSDSSIRDVPFIMRNFSDATPGCHDGKESETSDVSGNRTNYRIDQSSVGVPAVGITFGGICPNRNRRGDACALVNVDWQSTRIKDDPVSGAKAGTREHVAGVDQVTAIYVPDQKKWGLCESDFIGHLAFGSTFIR